MYNKAKKSFYELFSERIKNLKTQIVSMKIKALIKFEDEKLAEREDHMEQRYWLIFQLTTNLSLPQKYYSRMVFIHNPGKY